MTSHTIAECVIKHISTSKRIGRGMYKNDFHYEVDIYNPTKRKWTYNSSFRAKTKSELLKLLKQEYMI